MKIIAIARRDGGVSIMRIDPSALLAPLLLREAEAIAAAQLADLRAQAAAAEIGDATTMAEALVTIAEVKARQAAAAVQATTPDPQAVIEAEVARYDLSKRGVDDDGQPLGAPVAVSWREIDEAELAGLDRTYRGAWQDDMGLKVDMPKAREIHRQLLRAERATAFVQLDIALMRALEIEDPVQLAVERRSVAEAKQALRDAPARPEIDEAQTVEELSRLTLALLSERAAPAKA